MHLHAAADATGRRDAGGLPRGRQSTALLLTLVGLCAAVAASAFPSNPANASRPKGTPLPPWTSAATPVADTWIEVAVLPEQTPNATPQGGATSLRSGWWDFGIDEYTLLRFAVPTARPDHKLARAELELAITDAFVGTFAPPHPISGTMRLRLRAVTSPWDEATLTGGDPLSTGELEVQAGVAWGPCADGRCGTARIDLLPLVQLWRSSPPGSAGSLIMAAWQPSARPAFATTFTVGSRESERPPVLRLAERAIQAPVTWLAWLPLLRVPGATR